MKSSNKTNVPSTLLHTILISIILTTTSTNALSTDPPPSSSMMLPRSAYRTILSGKIAVVPNFIPRSLVSDLRNDAMDLNGNGHFSADALAAYGKEGGTKFDPSLDRTVLKLNQWKRTDIGNANLRHQTFGSIMSNLRTDLSHHLSRPHLDDPTSVSTTAYGRGSTEISYTRFGPGAFLKRHIDEHHEELKGVRGWEKPTRRSLSWLIYLNEEDWDVDKNGGCIRCFERKVPPLVGQLNDAGVLMSSSVIGAMPNGDLQIGWLRALPGDETKVERPVFLDGRMKNDDGKGNCAMYTLLNENDATPQYITKTFDPNPVLFLSGGDFFAKRLLVDNPKLAPRFHFLEPPRSAAEKFLVKAKAPTGPNDDEVATDIAPIGGTLVLFDSVSLPHEVLPSFGRERWAASGWYHEDQQRPAV